MTRIVTVGTVGRFCRAFARAARRRRRKRRHRAHGRLAPDAPSRDASSQSRKPLRRVPIYRHEWEPDVYPRYNPGPNAVRDCTATYVQEYRPSGTVIMPRMNCYWRRG